MPEQRGHFRVPFIVVPGLAPANSEGDNSLDYDEPVSSSSSQSAEMSPHESVSSSSRMPETHVEESRSPYFDVALSDLQQGYLGENENYEISPPTANNRSLFVDMASPPPRRSVRRRDGSGSMKSRSSTSSRRSRMKQSLHLDDPPTYSYRGASDLSRYALEKVLDSPCAVSAPHNDNSSESSRGEANSGSFENSERRRYPRRHRQTSSSSLLAPNSDFILKKRLSGLQLMLWTLFVAAVTSSTMLVWSNKNMTYKDVYPESIDFSVAPPVIHPQRNNLMHSEGGLRGKLVQGRAGRPKHSTTDRAMIIEENPDDHAPKTTDHKKHDKTFEKASEKKKDRNQKKSSTSHAKPDKKDKHSDGTEKASSVKAIVNKNRKKEKVSTSHTQTMDIIMGPLPVALPLKSISQPKKKFDQVDANMYSKQESESQRIVILGDYEQDDIELPDDHRTVKKYPAEFTDNTQFYPFLESDDERLSRMEIREPYSNEECVPMQDWQTTYQPSCNGMHELQLDSLGGSSGDDFNLFGTKGFWRHAWRVDLLGEMGETDQRDTVVLKTLKFEHNFEDAHFEHDRVDAVAMERLTSSPHVINIFGFCGHSVMTEYADGSRVGELADKAKKRPLERLAIARDIANGLADVHGIDGNGEGNATFVHLDINPANVVSVGGTLKLNDFNIGIIRRWNTTSNKPCGFPAQYPNPQWRSPEEARNEQNLTEKVDIFSMGHIFFRLICGHEPWNKLEPGGKPEKEDINEKVKRGVLPFIPEEIMNTEDKEVIAIRDVMLDCYKVNPKERPSARKIAKTLDKVLSSLSSKK